ncbi:MAG: gliding motility-associated C-terminal domain-containing protein, partial [Odoribacter sp.]
IIAPDAFLPESSNENSRFYLKEVNFVDRFEMYIYDRWGELIFKTDKIGYEGGWNGDFKGIKCQPGAYVWVAFVNGKEIERGTLMLIK